ncbi:cationic amino acid transporter 3 [Anastrepha obliqua]|uniref:cationic amino acid transporter 3 n=1 Tax=Anastrepha obliqua TaxID=95512 RepID=UPI00240A066F|nr:cationic amino acid transporter 3 [Anastrepha obliqua]XP_054735775.1 cationic amino acid transporter 3 [Anastrepha obliqua]XP_054735776.1 cationic amino acid transporter 3 [Anastrepha obliqua]XP_054735777.1 cationic amino acid transporter 3 [Anastrepha obliqua]XP_054735778.1 cationic amino acid transporter 3 [Anastrepha obliqua]XP_054735779.1 cationic amino acid transporter 3 [Anastrepha obliqua]XP_054735780.1 cationic amino acid transporter 3 [Anastrepha obliqua]XP_054735781.1 cationic a
MAPHPTYWKVLTRRKILQAEGVEGDTKLNRVLGLFDLTTLGVGSTLGAGVYVLAGQIARDQAGPSVMLSFAIAALASLLAGICYAEFGARVPKAGSAYVYSYVCIGEFVAFVIGWNLMLEYIIGTASVCRGISLYLDTLINDTLKNTFAEIAPINVSFLGSYFDFFAFGLVIIFGVALAFGVETSAFANNFCTSLNIFILMFVIVAGAIKANFANWSIDPQTVNATIITNDIGSGGFFPFGFAGTLKGAATCFFGFVGFDCIATTGEEVRNPRRNIPRSILLSLLIIFLCYFGVSTVLTLMVPYYEQDANAPLPFAFKQVGWTFAMWVVAIGGLIGLFASLFGALFPLPRVMYSMAEDGLLFRFLGKISPRFRVPVHGSIFAALFTSLMAGLFSLQQLVSLLSIGTLLAYSVVAISVTILRYMDSSDGADCESGNQPLSENSMLTSSGTRITSKAVLLQLFNIKRLDTPNSLSTKIVGCLLTVFCLLSLGIGVILKEAYDALLHNQLWALILLPVLVLLALLVLVAICLQPREPVVKTFRVPLVPLIPAVSVFINIYLMLQLDVMTWIRFGIWMLIGIPIFIACWCMYDISNPAKRNPERIAFERALKESARNNKPLNGHLAKNLKSNGALKKSKSANGMANGTNFSSQNERSVKSLDEIMNMNEVSDDLIEMRHPNGKVFYIEDNRSHTSKSSMEKADADKDGSREDEKSVIAMLDDVLQAADTGITITSNMPDYRKFSVDSEMLPSVIEMNTVATVHTSSNSSDDLEAVPEVESNKSSNSNSLSGATERFTASQQAAQQLVDEILNSTLLIDALERHKFLNEAVNLQFSEPTEAMKDGKAQKTQEYLTEGATEITQNDAVKVQANGAAKLTRTNSEASMLSIEDPIHSDQFRNRLSKILMGPPAQVSTYKPVTQQTLSTDSYSPRPQLKHSKSEADVRQLVLKAIEGTGVARLDSELSKRESNGEDIPIPPKFDPILYKTINSLRHNKERPSLQRLMENDEQILGQKAAIVAKAAEPTNEPALPFKQKLEAALKRGPSHRTQKRPEPIPTRRPKSVGPMSVQEEAETTQTKQRGKVPRRSAQSESNLATKPAEGTELISNARNLLKHVPNGTIELYG